ncbi:MAG: hypothetical protein ACWGPR_11590 [Candidatus Deferrimicrobiaceae bacterium]
MPEQPPNPDHQREPTPAQRAFELWGYRMARGDFEGAREALRRAKGGRA